MSDAASPGTEHANVDGGTLFEALQTITLDETPAEAEPDAAAQPASEPVTELRRTQRLKRVMMLRRRRKRPKQKAQNPPTHLRRI